jgi:hypothetical protein
MDYAKEVVKTALATVVYTSEMPTPPTLAAKNVGDGHSVEVNWNKSPEPDVKSYILYWWQEYDSLRDSILTFDTTYLVTDLTEGVTAYFIVSALDTEGYLSVPSEEVAIVPTVVGEEIVSLKTSISTSLVGHNLIVIFTTGRWTDLSLSIYDVAGRRVREKFIRGLNPGEHRFRLNLKGLRRGIYFLLLRTSFETYREKLLILP